MRRVAHPIAPLPLVSIKVRQPNGTTRTDFYLKPSKFRARFAADLPPRVAADQMVADHRHQLESLTRALLDAETLDAVDAYAAAGAHTRAGEPRSSDAVDPRAPVAGSPPERPLRDERSLL